MRSSRAARSSSGACCHAGPAELFGKAVGVLRGLVLYETALEFLRGTPLSRESRAIWAMVRVVVREPRFALAGSSCGGALVGKYR
jgi:hypothetical protein